MVLALVRGFYYQGLIIELKIIKFVNIVVDTGSQQRDTAMWSDLVGSQASFSAVT